MLSAHDFKLKKRPNRRSSCRTSPSNTRGFWLRLHADAAASELQPTVSCPPQDLMKRLSTQEAKYRTTGVIKAQVGSDVVPLDLHDLLCERLAQETEPKLAKLHLVMLFAFAYVV